MGCADVDVDPEEVGVWGPWTADASSEVRLADPDLVNLPEGALAEGPDCVAPPPLLLLAPPSTPAAAEAPIDCCLDDDVDKSGFLPFKAFSAWAMARKRALVASTVVRSECW